MNSYKSYARTQACCNILQLFLFFLSFILTNNSKYAKILTLTLTDIEILNVTCFKTKFYSVLNMYKLSTHPVYDYFLLAILEY